MQAALKPRTGGFGARDRRDTVKSGAREPRHVHPHPRRKSLADRSLSGPSRFAIIFFLGLASWALVAAAVLLIRWLA